MDRPGHGLSDEFNYLNTAVREHAVDVISTVIDGMKLSDANVVGNSMGGLWALQFALAKPERVTKLVLLGDPAGSSPVPTNRRRSRARIAISRQFVAPSSIVWSPTLTAYPMRFCRNWQA